ncbi:hypothetical protein ISU10_11275 [Nocardioides agariphilus]|uniref:Uncharacterized protein n=1 Tax=Nocardioides agariphilus TaxID=433664 RepID=A0A930VKH2_9ACTN|nr:hypothetical protein [Nocardioides agariphilus]MBF4768348.1 hypothetical protein [Nocardioides agariphilus]
MPETPVRHAIARSTGATTWTRKDGDAWRSTCLNHGEETIAPNRGKAWVTGSHPQDFCAMCAHIAAGKAEKIIGDRLPIPAPKATRKPDTRNVKGKATVPAKKAATK